MLYGWNPFEKKICIKNENDLEKTLKLINENN